MTLLHPYLDRVPASGKYRQSVTNSSESLNSKTLYLDRKPASGGCRQSVTNSS
jgi:hypothetical protein